MSDPHPESSAHARHALRCRVLASLRQRPLQHTYHLCEAMPAEPADTRRAVLQLDAEGIIERTPTGWTIAGQAEAIAA